MTSNLISTEGPQPDLPPLPFAEWEATCDTVHMWTQIVGKTRMTLSAPQNHWWHVPLYVTPHGLNTSAIPFGKRTFDVEFDFVAHQVAIRTSEGEGRSIPLYPRSVADFYSEYMACLRSLGIEVKFDLAPQEFDDPTPYDQDQRHASYDTQYMERFRRILVQTDQILKQFRSRYIGKCSPVHFFWGSFDLAVTRFNGERCPPPAQTNPIMAEAYSHQVISHGFWPGDRKFPHSSFYAYAVPAPAGFEKEPVHPGAWDPKLGEFILKYEAIRKDANPEQGILGFCQSTYEAGAKLAQWDREALECSK
ncbi:MAG TPA: DUF5996 family protein [Bryobacteraceae bacterium]|jgi:hypothetical protein